MFLNNIKIKALNIARYVKKKNYKILTFKRDWEADYVINLAYYL